MNTALGGVEYFVPESSERIHSEEHHILGSVWDEDQPDNQLMPEVTEAKVFSFDFEENDYRYWLLRNVGQMCVSARMALKDHATSWHGTKVGADMMAIDIEKSRVAFLSQGNHKPEEDHTTNCSEVNLLLAVTEILRYSQVAALCLAGPKNRVQTADGKVVSAIAENVMPTTTLQPCFRCDNALAAAPEVNDKTLIFSLAKHIDYMQFQTFKEYHTRQQHFALNGMVEDPRLYRFMSAPEIWLQNAEMYAVLRDRRGLKPGDESEANKCSIRKNKLLTEVLHTASVFYHEL